MLTAFALQLLAAQASGAASSGAAEAFPASDVLVAFADGCEWGLDGDTPPRPVDGVVVWTPALVPDGSEIARRAGQSPDARLFEADIAGRRLYLLLSAAQEGQGRTCQVIDFDAPEQIALADLVPWAGRHPDGQVGGYGEPRWGRYWAPGLFDGHARTEIYHVPAVSPLAASAHLRGLVLTTSTGTPN